MMNAMQRAAAVALGAMAWVGAASAGEGSELKSETAMTSYALGYQIGGDFRRQQVELDTAAVIRGIVDAHGGAAPAMSEAEMRQVLVELKRKVVGEQKLVVGSPNSGSRPGAAHDATGGANGTATPAATPTSAIPGAHAKRAAARGNDREKVYLDRNAQREGVVTLGSGLQYKVQKEGTGKRPQPGDTVALVYRGALANGNEFGHSEAGGKAVPLDSLVPGLREAVLNMKEGSHWEVVVPPELGFSANTPLFRKVTVFDLELVAVNP